MDTHEILTFLGLPANPQYYFVKCSLTGWCMGFDREA
jgi:hypothetical protein